METFQGKLCAICSSFKKFCNFGVMESAQHFPEFQKKRTTSRAALSIQPKIPKLSKREQMVGFVLKNDLQITNNDLR